MHSFVYEALPARVIFGSGTLSRIAEEIERLGLRRALVLSTPAAARRAERLAASSARSPLPDLRRGAPCTRRSR